MKIFLKWLAVMQAFAILLKAAGVLKWAWWAVLLPLWAAIGALLLAGILVLFINFILDGK